MASRTRYRWDGSRYRDTRTGRFVSAARVRQEIDHVLLVNQRRARTIAGDLRAGRISQQVWATEMRALITETHLYGAASARGGWASMDAAAYGQVGGIVREQRAFFDGFVADIEGGLPLDGAFGRRAQMYVQAGRATYHRAERQVQRGLGMTEERNILDVEAAHCEGAASCEAQTDLGWVPVGELLAVGHRVCLTACRCRLAYR